MSGRQTFQWRTGFNIVQGAEVLKNLYLYAVQKETGSLKSWVRDSMFNFNSMEEYSRALFPSQPEKLPSIETCPTGL